MSKWIPVGLTGIGAPGYNEAYVNLARRAKTPRSHIVLGDRVLRPSGRHRHEPRHADGHGDQVPPRPTADPASSGASSSRRTASRASGCWAIQTTTRARSPMPTSTAAKNAGIEVFTIGFGLHVCEPTSNCPDGSGTWNGKAGHGAPCEHGWSGPNCTTTVVHPPPRTLMATTSTASPAASDLTTVFSAVATQFAGRRYAPRQALPDPGRDERQPVDGARISVAQNVTVTGKYFSGATRVDVQRRGRRVHTSSATRRSTSSRRPA